MWASYLDDGMDDLVGLLEREADDKTLADAFRTFQASAASAIINMHGKLLDWAMSWLLQGAAPRMVKQETWWRTAPGSKQGTVIVWSGKTRNLVVREAHAILEAKQRKKGKGGGKAQGNSTAAASAGDEAGGAGGDSEAIFVSLRGDLFHACSRAPDAFPEVQRELGLIWPFGGSSPGSARGSARGRGGGRVT